MIQHLQNPQNVYVTKPYSGGYTVVQRHIVIGNL